MLMPICWLDNYFVDIYLEVPFDMMGDHNVNESLVGGVNAFEAERHDVIVVVSLV